MRSIESWRPLGVALLLMLPPPPGAWSGIGTSPSWWRRIAWTSTRVPVSASIQGDVQVDQGSIRIRADKVTVTQREGESRRVVAEGRPVTFQQQPEGKQELVKGRALRTEYDMDSELLVMIGDALLIQGEDTFKSDRIVYDRAKSVVKAGAAASGKERVRISIQPRAKGAEPASKPAPR
jgi:lipopolysaccharide transport protein LptA